MAGPKKSDAPRWEWRAFGSDLSSIEAKIGLAIQVAPRRSEEIYLLNAETPHSAKIRDGALEVKRLLQVDENGLELWKPAFRAPFPMAPEAVKQAFAALDIEPPEMLRSQYELDAFSSEIVPASDALRAVTVSKARRQFVFCDCAAEFVRLRVGAVAQESFAVEHEKPSRVMAALRELGLASRENVSFPKGVERASRLAQTPPGENGHGSRNRTEVLGRP